LRVDDEDHDEDDDHDADDDSLFIAQVRVCWME